MREKTLFNDNWKFHKGDFTKQNTICKGPDYIGAKTERMVLGPAAYNYSDNSDSYEPCDICPDNWETVNLPHDYIIEQVPNQSNPQALGYFNYENGWYRKHFTLEEADRNKRITLYFEGVATNAAVYLNGCLMKHNFCGYTPFEVDITDNVFFDKENIVAVYANADSHEGWWYQGGGIYRNVWLIKTADVAVDLWGVYVSPVKCEGDCWRVDIETTVLNSSFCDADISVQSVLLSTDGLKEIAGTESTVSVFRKDKALIHQSISANNPSLWDIESPNMYKIVTKIFKSGEQTDETETSFGFRTFEFDCDKGFILNGRQVKLKGVCSHQDYGLTGKAVPDNVYKYRIEMIKDMGANAYRTSHYPHSEATMEALDENGILVMDETRWYDSSDEGTEQLETLIKRDRNHPSVILWSVGNEEPKHITEQGRRIAQTMIAAVKRLDPIRPVTTAVSYNPLEATVYDLVDVIGVNYNLQHYEELHKRYPDKPFVITECCATGTTRGFYLDDNTERSFASAYDKDANNWFLGRERTWKYISEHEWISGGFQWIAFEHRGECIWPRLCSLSGAIDMYLQKKDAFYQNKSHWTKEPMVHILPHWNHNGLEGESIKVWVYTNCEDVELFLNGKSLGSEKIERIGHGEWIVPYENGTLKAIGKNNGKAAAEESVETTGKAVALRLSLDNKIQYANGRDFALLTCVCIDEKGREVPDAEAYIKFYTNKLGAVAGTGSDISDHIPPKYPNRKMRAGKCSVAVRVGNEPGILKVYAFSENLGAAVISIPLE